MDAGATRAPHHNEMRQHMAWAERVSARSWRVRYWKDDGSVGSVYGFTTKTAAQDAAADMESDQRAGIFIDPHRGKTTLADWVDDWLPALDVDIRTEENYRAMLRRHILPRWGATSLSDISSIKVTAWAKTLRSDGLAPATVSGITKLFTMILADAVAERLIAYNPAQLRRRGRGRTARPAEKVWATPQQALAVADQAALCYHPWARCSSPPPPGPGCAGAKSPDCTAATSTSTTGTSPSTPTPARSMRARAASCGSARPRTPPPHAGSPSPRS